MNETLTVFMISEIERLREEGREPARRIYIICCVRSGRVQEKRRSDLKR